MYGEGLWGPPTLQRSGPWGGMETREQQSLVISGDTSVWVTSRSPGSHPLSLQLPWAASCPGSHCGRGKTAFQELKPTRGCSWVRLSSRGLFINLLPPCVSLIVDIIWKNTPFASAHERCWAVWRQILDRGRMIEDLQQPAAGRSADASQPGSGNAGAVSTAPKKPAASCASSALGGFNMKSGK